MMRQLRLAFLFSLSVAPSIALCQQADIKGIHVGMTKDELLAIVGTPLDTTFSVAGIRSKYKNIPVDFKYRDGKLDTFYFFFNASNFDQMHSAITAKYPTIKCNNSTVTNAYRASFTQTMCELRDDKGMLILRRFTSDVHTSVLSIASHESIKELAEKSKKDRGDI